MALDPSNEVAIQLFANAPVGLQLADPAERHGRCWRASTRFIAALRYEQSDGLLLVWHGEGWEHGAVLAAGSNLVVDWTASQFEKDPVKAAGYEYPLVRTRSEMDKLFKCRSQVLNLDDPFLVLPEPVFSWDLARERIRGIDDHDVHV
jgi:hypothetical protein